MALTTLAKVKEYAGVTGTADDALLNSLIAELPAVVKSLLLGRELEATAYVEQYDGTGRDFLILKQRPINSITEVKIDSAWGFGDGITAIDTAELFAEPGSGILYIKSSRFPQGRRNVRVTYNAGYVTMPGDIERAANITVADWYTRAKQLASGQSQNELASESTGERSDSYHKEATEWGVPAQAKAYFERYAPCW
jgi:hypothetical protein